MKDNDKVMLLQKGMDAISLRLAGTKGQLWKTAESLWRIPRNGREDIRGRFSATLTPFKLDLTILHAQRVRPDARMARRDVLQDSMTLLGVLCQIKCATFATSAVIDHDTTDIISSLSESKQVFDAAV